MPDQVKPLISPLESRRTRGFLRFIRFASRYGFESIEIDCESYAAAASCPSNKSILVFANHPSFWDPVLALLIFGALFPTRKFYAPMDFDALQRFRILKGFGFFPVDRGSVSGVKKFFSDMEAILDEPNSLVFITPQNRISKEVGDALGFTRGIVSVLSRSKNTTALPLAVNLQSSKVFKNQGWLKLGERVDPVDYTRLDKLEASFMEVYTSLEAKIASKDSSSFVTLARSDDKVSSFLMDSFRDRLPFQEVF